MAPAQYDGGKNWKQNMSGGGARGRPTECLAPVDLWKVDLKDKLYSGFKKCDTNADWKHLSI